jgi:methyl-accepting chemotaxis protein
MAKLSTARRIAIGFAIAPLVLICLTFYALHDLATLKEQAMVIVKQDWPKIDPIMVIATGVRDNARNTRDLLIDKENQQAQLAIDATKKRISQALETLEPLLDSPDGKAAYVALKKNREAYVAAFTQVQVLIRQGDFDPAMTQLKQHVIPAEQQVYKSLDALMLLQGQIFADRERSAQALYNDARLNMLGWLVFCLASVIAATVIVTRSVTRPLGGEPIDAARVLSQIAQGDLTIQVPLNASVGDSVMMNMHQMQQSLNSMVKHIEASVAQVASSSEELSAVSSQTSSSLQLQGLEIEQAAAAVNQMTAAVDEVARNAVSTSEASQVSQVSQVSEQTAQRGREQVQEFDGSEPEGTRSLLVLSVVVCDVPASLPFDWFDNIWCAIRYPSEDEVNTSDVSGYRCYVMSIPLEQLSDRSAVDAAIENWCARAADSLSVPRKSHQRRLRLACELLHRCRRPNRHATEGRSSIDIAQRRLDILPADVTHQRLDVPAIG